MSDDDLLLYSLEQAARRVGYSKSTLRIAALKTADDGVFPHPLKAKRGGRNALRIPPQALLDWIDLLPDAHNAAPPVSPGTTLVSSAPNVVINLAVAMLYTVLDPRIQY